MNQAQRAAARAVRERSRPGSGGRTNEASQSRLQQSGRVQTGGLVNGGGNSKTSTPTSVGSTRGVRGNTRTKQEAARSQASSENRQNSDFADEYSLQTAKDPVFEGADYETENGRPSTESFQGSQGYLETQNFDRPSSQRREDPSFNRMPMKAPPTAKLSARTEELTPRRAYLVSLEDQIKAKKERQAREKAAEEAFDEKWQQHDTDIFGRPGCGAPLRDADGRIKTIRTPYITSPTVSQSPSASRLATGSVRQNTAATRQMDGFSNMPQDIQRTLPRVASKPSSQESDNSQGSSGLQGSMRNTTFDPYREAEEENHMVSTYNDGIEVDGCLRCRNKDDEIALLKRELRNMQELLEMYRHRLGEANQR